MGGLFTAGVLILLIGMVYSIFQSFRVSKLAGYLNMILWPVPFLYCAVKDFKTVRVSMIMIILGAGVMYAGFLLDPSVHVAFKQASVIMNGY